jgi:hypothetical protein
MAKISVSMNFNGFGGILTILILYWLFKIDDCKCTHIEEGKYLKEWFLFEIIIQVIFFVYLIATGNLNSNYSNILTFIAIIIAVISLVMVIRLVIFIHKLKEINCNCGLTKLENFIYYWYIVGFSIALFMLLLGFLYFILK